MKYEVENKELNILMNHVNIPEYQRDFVWNKSKQENLIRSLILEYPIGVLTAYKNNNVYTVLDGLQRITTIKSFQVKPSNVMKFTTLIEILNIDFNKTSDVKSQANKVKQYFKSWYENIEDLDKIENDTYEFIEELEEAIENNATTIEISKIDKKAVREIYKNMMRNTKFLDVKVPLIVCIEFNDDELTDVFEKMNTGSMKLSKYEVFVAQWDKYGKIKFDDSMAKRINTVIKSRNEILKNSDYSFEKEETVSSERYLYEYILTLSDLLQKNEFALKSGDQLGYEVLALLLINNVYGINKVVSTSFVCKDTEAYKEGLEEFLMKIFEIIEDSIDAISEYLSKEEYKFAKYFKLITYIRKNNDINLDSFDINPTPLSQSEIHELMNYHHDFENERQTTYLHRLILECLDLIEKKEVSLYNITHAGTPHPEDMIRIQVRPIKLGMDLEENKYSGIVGQYEFNNTMMYVEFSTDEIIKSLAKNKSVYVKLADIETFYKNEEEVFEVEGDKYVNKIMNSSFFNKYYSIYN